MSITFNLLKEHNQARAGLLTLPHHGEVETPVFMPVGTQATVKTLDSNDLNELGVTIMLANAYHLYLRPGQQIIKAAGGIHQFMRWPKGVITDSGGFQVFSLSDLRKITEDGVEFTSHLDGSKHFFSPQSNMVLQHDLGADIIMALDVCVAYPSTLAEVNRAVELTTNWAKLCLKTHLEANTGQSLFGIIQGGIFPEAREKSARELIELDFPGYAIGGLSVGEGPQLMSDVLNTLNPILPREKPRYLMGVGTPEDLWAGIEQGVDMFDCAMPTRIARNGTLYTSTGRLVVKNANFSQDFRPPDLNCHCYVCKNYSRAYLRHLFNTKETIALRLSTLHNLSFMLNLTDFIRKAIINERFEEAKKDFFAKYQ